MCAVSASTVREEIASTGAPQSRAASEFSQSLHNPSHSHIYTGFSGIKTGHDEMRALVGALLAGLALAAVVVEGAQQHTTARVYYYTRSDTRHPTTDAICLLQ